MRRRPLVRRVVSAGGVVWRRGDSGGIEVVLCGRRDARLWALPKGTPDARERLIETAVREVREETGLEVEPGEKLGVIDYWFAADGVRYHKFVHHWLMEPTGGDLSQHDDEFDCVEWRPIGEARRTLSYRSEQKLLDQAEQALESGE
ncbi:MAG: NUDIX hydrolase [Dehalococcoidia bacterium]